MFCAARISFPVAQTSFLCTFIPPLNSTFIEKNCMC